MKSLIKAVAIAAVLAAPVISFAQTNEPVTRAQEGRLQPGDGERQRLPERHSSRGSARRRTKRQYDRLWFGRQWFDPGRTAQ
jgi:Ni/Co efflux regulator RcnB